LEVAGTVVAVGSAVQRWRCGDSVTALTNGGGYAEYCVAPETQCLPWPAGFTAVQAASLPETYFTVWANLMLHGRFQTGEPLELNGKRYIVARAGDIAAISKSGNPVALKLAIVD
jgi:NADPH2:quinone reductase